jgi:hypothetical protein
MRSSSAVNSLPGAGPKVRCIGGVRASKLPAGRALWSGITSSILGSSPFPRTLGMASQAPWKSEFKSTELIRYSLSWAATAWCIGAPGAAPIRGSKLGDSLHERLQLMRTQ